MKRNTVLFVLALIVLAFAVFPLATYFTLPDPYIVTGLDLDRSGQDGFLYFGYAVLSGRDPIPFARIEFASPNPDFWWFTYQSLVGDFRASRTGISFVPYLW